MAVKNDSLDSVDEAPEIAAFVLGDSPLDTDADDAVDVAASQVDATTPLVKRDAPAVGGVGGVGGGGGVVVAMSALLRQAKLDEDVKIDMEVAGANEFA